jgi:hypothetical protein
MRIMPNSKGTAMEALVAEMLGDIGKLHGSVRALRTEFVELNRVQQKNIDNHASKAVNEAISEASAESFSRLTDAAIDLLTKMAEAKNIKPNVPVYFGVKLTFCILLVVIGIAAGTIFALFLLHK